MKQCYKTVLKCLMLFVCTFSLLHANNNRESALDVGKQIEKSIIKDGEKFAKIDIKYSCITPLFIKDYDKKELTKNQETVASIELWGVKGDCNWFAIYDIEKLKQAQQKSLQNNEKNTYVPGIEYQANFIVSFKLKGLQKAKIKDEISYFIVFANKDTQEIISKENYTIKISQNVKEGKEYTVKNKEEISILHTFSASAVGKMELLIGFNDKKQ